ncbi:hypothetical protein KY284_017217 [Solanum tuberosum]|nr:hypothetical protein KY284_017217 [Solanum tuberosum]
MEDSRAPAKAPTGPASRMNLPMPMRSSVMVGTLMGRDYFPTKCTKNQSRECRHSK